jgi:hypothetical protein
MFTLASARAFLKTGHAAPYRLCISVPALAICAALTACAPRPEIPPVAQAESRAAATGYSPVLSGYRSARPAEAKPWRERNDAVAPKEKP